MISLMINIYYAFYVHVCNCNLFFLATICHVYIASEIFYALRDLTRGATSTPLYVWPAATAPSRHVSNTNPIVYVKMHFIYPAHRIPSECLMRLFLVWCGHYPFTGNVLVVVYFHLWQVYEWIYYYSRRENRCSIFYCFAIM